jgi:membrane protease subunit HflK
MPGDENLSTDEEVRRSVSRTLGNAALLLIGLAVLGAWASLGLYQLNPGQSAIILRLGRHVDTVTRPGLEWHLPAPLETRTVVDVDKIEQQSFGAPGDEEGSADVSQAELEASMQTRDNNIVRVSFVVRYLVKDAFESRYRVAAPRETLRDASQAAIREVVGRMTIDGVLSEQRGAVQADTEQILQDILDAYESGLHIDGVELQEVQPPSEVKAAFDDVIGAAQDASRKVNEAEGYRNEVVPAARAEAAERIAGADGYRDSRIAEATGEAERFRALAAEYKKAPRVTEKRLYLETMEAILPSVEKVIVEPGTTQLLPYLPLGRSGRVGSP